MRPAPLATLAASIAFACGTLAGWQARDGVAIAPPQSGLAPRPIRQLEATSPLSRREETTAPRATQSSATSSRSSLGDPTTLAAITTWLPAEASVNATATYIETLLALGEPLAALETLRTHPRAGMWTYFETALALTEMNWDAEATTLFVEAMRRDYDDEDLQDAFVAHDPAAFLDVVQELQAVFSGSEYDTDGLSILQARALLSLGDAGQAVQHLPPLEEYFAPSSGCTPAHVKGTAWELEAWRAVDPAGLQELLIRVLETSPTSQENALAELAATCAVTGDEATFLEQLQKFGDQHYVHGELLVALAPHRGWDAVEEHCRRKPFDDTAAYALGEHFLSQGRPSDAARVWTRHFEACWSEDEPPGELYDFVAHAPDQMLSVVERRIADLASASIEHADPSWELCSYAELYWNLGDPRRAKQLWLLADELDPGQAGSGAETARLYELGVLE
jgi:tetratricopeptide (TPR) repeat protein